MSRTKMDRSGTAMRRLTPDTFDWTTLTAAAGAVLTSGITCALGAGPAAAATALLAAGRGNGAVTAFDVNHRDRLWTWEEAAPVLRGVPPHVDVLLANRGDLLRLPPSAREDEDAAALARRAIGEFGHELLVLRKTDQLPGRRIASRVTVVTAAEVVTGGVHEADVVDAFGAGDAALGVLPAARLAGDDTAALADKAAWAGAVAAGLGSDLVPVAPGPGDLPGIARRAAAVAEQIAAVRSGAAAP
ncbi:PfkB family carbohydrate kinase [Spirillospora sp. CA-255316]